METVFLVSLASVGCLFVVLLQLAAVERIKELLHIGPPQPESHKPKPICRDLLSSNRCQQLQFQTNEGTLQRREVVSKVG